MGEPGRCGRRRGGSREQEREEEEGKERGRGLGRAALGVGPRWPAQPLKCNLWGTGFCLMRPLQGCRGRGIVVGTVTLCLAAGWALQSKCPSPFLLPSASSPALPSSSSSSSSPHYRRLSPSAGAGRCRAQRGLFPTLPGASGNIYRERGRGRGTGVRLATLLSSCWKWSGKRDEIPSSRHPFPVSQERRG